MKNSTFRLSQLHVVWMVMAIYTVVFSSCVAVKKQYSPGYHIEWKSIGNQVEKNQQHSVLSKNHTKTQTKKSVQTWPEPSDELIEKQVIDNIAIDSNLRPVKANFQFNQVLIGHDDVVAAKNKYIAKYENGIQIISKKSKTINQESRSLLTTIFITLTIICIALAIYLFISSGFMYGTASLSVLFSSLVLSLAEKKSLMYKIAIALLLVGYCLIIIWWIQFNASWPR